MINQNISIHEKNIAFTDLETTGLDFRKNEIIEIGLILVNQKNLNILDEWQIKIKPEHIEKANLKSLEVNGYKKEDWKDAIALKDALKTYAQKVQGTIFCSHNTTFDWAFMEEAFLVTGLMKDTDDIDNVLDYHRLDIFSLAWGILKDKKLEKFNLS